jgi:hypothetical protein
MADDRDTIKQFIHALASENYSGAYTHLKTVVYEKTKKRCAAAYDRVKNSHGLNK